MYTLFPAIYQEAQEHFWCSYRIRAIRLLIPCILLGTSCAQSKVTSPAEPALTEISADDSPVDESPAVQLAHCVLHAGSSQVSVSKSRTVGGEIVAGKQTGQCEMGVECIRMPGAPKVASDGFASIGCTDSECLCQREWILSGKQTQKRLRLDKPCRDTDHATEILLHQCLKPGEMHTGTGGTPKSSI